MVNSRTAGHKRPPLLRPWHFVLAFGIVSLLADMVYEGARSIIGPYLATLGASATLVGVVAGAGEFIGYGLRVISGLAVSRTRHYWAWTITGYALTILSVPLIGATGAIAPALLLYGTERLGKAVRSPAKDTLLSHASTGTGRGAAFGVHQALDQTGAMLGPLLLAAILSWREGDYRLAFGVLAIPGVLVIALLFWLRKRVPDPAVYEHGDATVDPTIAARPASTTSTARTHLPARFWLYAAAVAVLSCGVAPFPLGEVDPSLPKDGDIEDLFAVSDYLKLYNWAFKKSLTVGDLNGTTGRILGRIESAEGKFNHSLPAHALTDNQDGFFENLDPASVSNFEKLYALLNAGIA